MGETVPWSNFSLSPVSSARPFFQSNGARCWCCSSCGFLFMDLLFADLGQISGVEISRDIIRHVRKVYQSVRVSETKLNHYGLLFRYSVAEFIAWQMWAHENFLFCLQVYVSSYFAATVPHLDLGAIRNRLPLNVTLAQEIKRFLPVDSKFSEGQVELVDGTVSPMSHILSTDCNKNVSSFLGSTTLYLRQVFDIVSLFYRSTITPPSA